MNKEIVFKMARTDMQNILNQLNLDNLTSQRILMNHYFDFLEKLILVDDTSNDEKENEVSPYAVSSKKNIYQMERKLRGGYLPEANQFIPEGIIRNLNLENGDLIRIEETPSYSRERYNFSLAEKGDGKPAPGRHQINYCLVEKDGDLLVVKQSFENGKQNIRIGELPYTFIIKEEDIRYFDLQEHDLVDMAYYEEKPETMKIIWQHPFIDEPTTSPQKSGAYKSKIKGIDSLILKTLQDQKILIIGCEPRKAVFQKNIEDRGGFFLWSEVADEALIRKADMVIILIRFIRHQTSYDAVRLAKEYNKPFTTIETLGVQSIIDAAEGILNS